MSDEEIELLRKALQYRNLYWMQEGEPSHRVVRIGSHPEEGDDDPCAIFKDGKYVWLYGASFEDFATVVPLTDLLQQEA